MGGMSETLIRLEALLGWAGAALAAIGHANMCRRTRKNSLPPPLNEHAEAKILTWGYSLLCTESTFVVGHTIAELGLGVLGIDHILFAAAFEFGVPFFVV